MIGIQRVWRQSHQDDPPLGVIRVQVTQIHVVERDPGSLNSSSGGLVVLNQINRSRVEPVYRLGTLEQYEMGFRKTYVIQTVLFTFDQSGFSIRS